MICAVCLSVKRAEWRKGVEPTPPPATSASVATCERCGRVLDSETTDRLAAKVTQLARFGLTGRPLFSRRRA